MEKIAGAGFERSATLLVVDAHVSKASPAASTLKVVGPIAISRLIGREVGDERGLSLAQSPAFIVRQDEEGGDDVRYAVILGEALGRRKLMDLLYMLAPYKAHGLDRFARVLDNWGLHDRAAVSSGSESLLLVHAKSLKSNWHEFARHRRSFMAVFEDQSEQTCLIPVVTWRKSLDGVRRVHFDALDEATVGQLADSVPILRTLDGDGRSQLSSLLGLVTLPYFLPQLRKNWAPWQSLVKNGKSNYIGPASVPMMALMHRRALLNSALVLRAEELFDTADTQAS